MVPHLVAWSTVSAELVDRPAAGRGDSHHRQRPWPAQLAAQRPDCREDCSGLLVVVVVVVAVGCDVWFNQPRLMLVNETAGWQSREWVPRLETVVSLRLPLCRPHRSRRLVRERTAVSTAVDCWWWCWWNAGFRAASLAWCW